MKVAERPERTYSAGEAFFEEPGELHSISANASTSAPARFVAIFICPGEEPLSVPAHPAPAERSP